MSSHREAPEISKDPVADSTDLYAFVSPDKPGTVTLIANYLPLEGPAGGPNFYEFGDDVLYAIHIDTHGRGEADITYKFNFHTQLPHPDTFLYNTGPITSLTSPNWNRRQTYSVTRVDGRERHRLGEGLICPPCNIGPLSTPHYATALAERAVHKLSDGSRVFAGQRAEGFYVDLGSIFDLGDLRPFQNFQVFAKAEGLKAAPGVNTPKFLNVHSIALQVPISRVTARNRPVIGVGCGSFEVSWLRCEGEAFAVSGVVDVFVFAAEVVAPVGVEVAAGDQGAELEDGLGAFEAPSRAGDVHSVLDDVPARALDDTGCDGPALAQCGGVVQVAALVVQVAGALVGSGALGGRVAAGGSAAADPGRGLAGVAVQDLAGLAGDPFLGGGLAFAEEGPGGLPQVFQDVDEVDDDRDRDAAGGGLRGDGLDLGAVAVHEHGPFPAMTWVAALGLVEGGGDDRGDARDRGGVVDAGQLGHPLAAVLLPRRQPRSELALRRGGGLRSRRAQRARQHHDALPIEGQHQRPPVRRWPDHAP